MEVVAAAQHMLVTMYAAAGAAFGGALVMALLAAFISVRVSWKAKAAFLLWLASETGSLARVIAIWPWASKLIFHHH